MKNTLTAVALLGSVCFAVPCFAQGSGQYNEKAYDERQMQRDNQDIQHGQNVVTQGQQQLDRETLEIQRVKEHMQNEEAARQQALQRGNQAEARKAEAAIDYDKQRVALAEKQKAHDIREMEQTRQQIQRDQRQIQRDKQ